MKFETSNKVVPEVYKETNIELIYWFDETFRNWLLSKKTKQNWVFITKGVSYLITTVQKQAKHDLQ